MLLITYIPVSYTHLDVYKRQGPGSLILLDCREPHSYHALTPIRMRWFHFAGSGSTAYTHLILNTCLLYTSGADISIAGCKGIDRITLEEPAGKVGVVAAHLDEPRHVDALLHAFQMRLEHARRVCLLYTSRCV